MFSLKNIICTLALTLYCGSSLFAQDARRSVADSLRFEGELSAATEAYRVVFKAQPEEGQNRFNLATTYALQPHLLDSAFHYLHLTLERDSTMRPLWDADLFYMLDDDRWPMVEEIQLARLEETVTGGFNKEYARQLFRIRMREHAYRYHIMLAMRKLGQESPIVTALAKAMSEHHDDNMVRLVALIQEHGWPAFSSVGEAAAYAAGNVINHADLETRKRYLPMLKAVCEKGEAEWDRYAHILDRTELEQGNKQVYGTQMAFNEESKRFEPQPLVDPDTVNERRAALGMEPIEDQLSRFNQNVLRDFGISNK